MSPHGTWKGGQPRGRA